MVVFKNLETFIEEAPLEPPSLQSGLPPPRYASKLVLTPYRGH